MSDKKKNEWISDEEIECLIKGATISAKRMLAEQKRTPLTDIPEPQMTLYGIEGITSRDTFFDTYIDAKEYVIKHGMKEECIRKYDFLGNVGGRDDVIRVSVKGKNDKYVVACDEDGYGFYNEYIADWEHILGSIKMIYNAFKARGQALEQDIYGQIEKREQKYLKITKTFFGRTKLDLEDDDMADDGR